MSRVAAFAVQSDGSRSFGVSVNGLRVLVTASEGQHDAGRELAEAITKLGPESAPTIVAERPASVPAAPAQEKPRRVFAVGQRVWCNVHGSRGWCTVAEIGTERNRGRIKIQGLRSWCPIHNFDDAPPEKETGT